MRIKTNRISLRENKQVAIKYNALMDEFISKAKYEPAENDWSEQTKELIDSLKLKWARIEHISKSKNKIEKNLFSDAIKVLLAILILEHQYASKADKSYILHQIRCGLSPKQAAIEIIKSKNFETI